MFLNLDKVKVVLFDWDNTLAETRSTLVAAINQVLAENNLPKWEALKDKRDKNLSFRDNFPLLFGKRAEELYQKYKIIYKSLVRTRLTAFPKAEETLRFLRSRGIKTAIMSNKDRELLEYELPLIFDKTLFDKIVCGHEALRDKPFSEHALYALEGLLPLAEISQNTVWIIGDSEQDSDCAKAAGVLPIRIGQPIWAPQAEPEADILHFADFSSFLQSLKQS